MANFYATPDVYIEEITSHQESSVSINTAIPAFVGYTEKALDSVRPLLNVPTKIFSLEEYEHYFGKAPVTTFDIQLNLLDLSRRQIHFNTIIQKRRFILYYSVVLFFANGGTECYIVSTGNYKSSNIEAKALMDGIDQLVAETEPTILVVPESILLEKSECYQVQKKMLYHCGFQTKSRFAIIDVYDNQDSYKDTIKEHKKNLGTEFLAFGASYYPYIQTNIVSSQDIDFLHLHNPQTSNTTSITPSLISEDFIEILKNEIQMYPELKDPLSIKLTTRGNALHKLISDLSELKVDIDFSHLQNTTEQLKRVSPFFNLVCKEIAKQINILPPSGAIAGIYAKSDNEFSVGKAPANFTIQKVIQPIVPINSKDQEELNRPLDGKAINVIRAFPGKGTMVWGARTMDGNNPLWRYLNVKRSMIYLQQSIKAIAEKFVFKPNDEGTWVLIDAAITNFLTDAWMEGVLKGGEPEEAFSVEIGEGGKMAFNDVLDGFILITIKVAIVRPMEFIVVKFKQNVTQT